MFICEMPSTDELIDCNELPALLATFTLASVCVMASAMTLEARRAASCRL